MTEKLILIAYFRISEKSTKEQINKVIENLSVGFDQAFKDQYHCFYIPAYEGDTRIECINPKLVSEEDYKKAKEALSLGQEMMYKFLKENAG
jgi:hypothetical protein